VALSISIHEAISGCRGAGLRPLTRNVRSGKSRQFLNCCVFQSDQGILLFNHTFLLLKCPPVSARQDVRTTIALAAGARSR
jgi:hypothetical protein